MPFFRETRSQRPSSLLRRMFVGVWCLIMCKGISVAKADTINVNWLIPSGGGPLPPITAEVGDTLTFTWSGFHNVYLHPSGGCDESGRVFVGSSSPASYATTSNDVGDVVFSCDVGSHCEFGQLITVTVSEPATKSPSPSFVPSAEPSRTPSLGPSEAPSSRPSSGPSTAPSSRPSSGPSTAPSSGPSTAPSSGPSTAPSLGPSKAPSFEPSSTPSKSPSESPSSTPSAEPSKSRTPTKSPVVGQTNFPSSEPSIEPSDAPSVGPSVRPSADPSSAPSATPSLRPSGAPSSRPSSGPSVSPSFKPSLTPSESPSSTLSAEPSKSRAPTKSPVVGQTNFPSSSPSGPSVGLSARPSPSGASSSSPSVAPSSSPSVAPSAFSVPTAAGVSIPWTIPGDGGPLPPRTARVGDRVVFEWSFGHNVYVHPSGTCDQTDRVLVGEEGGASYVFTEEGEIVFACDAPGHCELGQIVTFTVSSEEGPSTPTDPPTLCRRRSRLFGLVGKLLLRGGSSWSSS